MPPNALPSKPMLALNVLSLIRITSLMASPEKLTSARISRLTSVRPRTFSSSTALRMYAQSASLLVTVAALTTTKRLLQSVLKLSLKRTCPWLLTTSSLAKFAVSMLPETLLMSTRTLVPRCFLRSLVSSARRQLESLASVRHFAIAQT